jgi:AcrR family transcriptional regulator
MSLAKTKNHPRPVVRPDNRSSRQDGAATRERILAVALRLFSERGIDAVSTRDILAGASANAGAIHYHFGSKKNLVTELIRVSFEDLAARETASFGALEADASPSPRAVVEALVRPFQDLVADEHGQETVRFLLETWRHPTHRELHQSYEEPMQRRRLAAVQRVTPHLSPEEQIVWTIVASGVVVRFIASGEIDSLAQAMAPPGARLDTRAAVVRFMAEAFTPAAPGPAAASPRRRSGRQTK